MNKSVVFIIILLVIVLSIIVSQYFHKRTHEYKMADIEKAIRKAVSYTHLTNHLSHPQSCSYAYRDVRVEMVHLVEFLPVSYTHLVTAYVCL